MFQLSRGSNAERNDGSLEERKRLCTACPVTQRLCVCRAGLADTAFNSCESLDIHQDATETNADGNQQHSHVTLATHAWLVYVIFTCCRLGRPSLEHIVLHRPSLTPHRQTVTTDYSLKKEGISREKADSSIECCLENQGNRHELPIHQRLVQLEAE